jgi:hypothetical protein
MPEIGSLMNAFLWIAAGEPPSMIHRERAGLQFIDEGGNLSPVLGSKHSIHALFVRRSYACGKLMCTTTNVVSAGRPSVVTKILHLRSSQ